MGFFSYLPEYRLRDMASLLRNEKLPPKQCDASLQEKTAVITGATSGIGRATARLFASRGAALVCVNRCPQRSAQALLYLAAAPELSGVSGRFFNLTAEEKPAPHAVDASMVEPVWERSLALCGLG